MKKQRNQNEKVSCPTGEENLRENIYTPQAEA